MMLATPGGGVPSAAQFTDLERQRAAVAMQFKQAHKCPSGAHEACIPLSEDPLTHLIMNRFRYNSVADYMVCFSALSLSVFLQSVH